MVSDLPLQLYAAAIGRLRPRSGLTKLSFNPPTNTLISRVRKDRLAETTDGIRIPIDLDDYHGRVLWLFGNNDFKVSDVCCALTRPGDTFLDIGANHGTIGLSVHAAVSGSIVHLFDPQPAMVDRLTAAIAQVRPKSVFLHPVALFDRDDTLEMKVPDAHSGMATLVNDAETVGRHTTVRVRTVSTSPCIRGLVGEQPFGLKIDVEGAEPEILAPLLAFENLRFVVFEGVNRVDELYNLFTRHDFVVYGFSKDVFSVRLQRCAQMKDWAGYHDFLGIPRRLSPDDAVASLERLRQHLNRVEEMA